jgi:hypothetical protein
VRRSEIFSRVFPPRGTFSASSTLQLKVDFKASVIFVKLLSIRGVIGGEEFEGMV